MKEELDQVRKFADWRVQAPTLCQLFETSADRYADHCFIRCEAGELSYAQAQSVIAHLAGKLGPELAGKPVGLFLANSAAWIIAYYAILRAGGQPALFNASMPPSGLKQLIAQVKPIFTLAAAEIDGADTKVFTDSDVFELASSIPITKPAPSASKPSDIAAIMFTGGTTGLPKRVHHSHRALIAKVERIEWGWPTYEQEVWLPVAPFTHVYGYLFGATNPILRGGKVVIPALFKPDLIVDLLAKEKVTIFGGGPPAIYQAVMAASNFETADLSALRVCPGGGASFPAALHEAWEAKTGLKIYEGIGMTEIAPSSVNTQHSGRKIGTTGKACPDTSIQVVDIETGEQVLTAGEVGEFRIKGPHMMTGYEGNPEETAIGLRHGYVYTGDIGFIDQEGFVTVTDRKKNVIFHKGFNVFPREVEEVLMGHAAVRQAAVIGVADQRAGEAVWAFVALADQVSLEALKDHCESLLAAYKKPQTIVVLDELPLTPNKKVDVAELKQMAAHMKAQS